MAFCNRTLYFSPEEEVMLKTLELSSFSALKESRLLSIFLSILILGESIMQRGFIILQQASSMLLFKWKLHAHFLVVPHARGFISSQVEIAFLFFFFFKKIIAPPSCLLHSVCSHLYEDIPTVGFPHVDKEHIC